MKTLCISLALITTLSADPQVNSWFTDNSGKYARIYETTADESAQNSVTTWSRGQGIQNPATYSGIHEVASNDNWVYIRTTGLASHLMGPWYLDAAKTNLFPNYPSNTGTIYRIPRVPTQATDKTKTILGAAGYYVNGVAMFNSLDAFSYINSSGTDATPSSTINGDGIWNRDAYVNENVTFDAANAHQAGSLYHYHASSPGLRHQLGDSVDYNASTNTYTENPAALTVHSPILGWAADGYPVYGPYGYSTPNNSSSTVRRMLTGYSERIITQRTTLPQWAADITNRSTTLDADETGPVVNNSFPVGHYAEDYEFTDNGDLDLYNGRTCVTPEFPGGTYAYFITIEEDGTPVYPYALATQYYGIPTGSVMTGLPGNVTFHFQGGPEFTEKNETIADNNGDLLITWSTIEGGTYKVQSSTTLGDNSWIDEAVNISPNSNALSFNTPANLDKEFFRLNRTSIDGFDDNGFDYDDTDIDDPNTEPDAKDNILLLIVDDWGIDASIFDNTASGNNISFAPMPNLQALVDRGLRFTNAYANPTCSVTRGSIISGRLPFRTGVGNPTTNNTLPDSELALAEAFTSQGSEYNLASFGKWHLGSGDTGPASNGGWTDFRGIIPGGVDSYTLWDKTTNGVTIDNNTTYVTTDQVNDTVDFITAQGTDPWFAWVGFVAPHVPFHNPPNGQNGLPLESYPDYQETNGEVTGANRKLAYQAALEALDTEIGRLLESVDLDTTNIIVIGDNGTPSQTVQTPFSNQHAKGSLFEGGTHVPLIVAGPIVTATGTTDTLVHCADLYTTILDLAGIDSAAATAGITLDSQSIVPILNGTDTADRCVVIEQFGDAVDNGRALISDDYPDFKLVIEGSPIDTSDTPQFSLYNLSTDENEQSPLNLTNLSAEQQLAYDHLLAKDAALGGGYSDPAISQDTLYLELAVTTGTSSAPQNTDTLPTTITIDGVAATVVSRVNESENPDRYWVKCTISPIASSYSTGTVQFTGLANGDATRTFTPIQIIVAP